VSGPDVVVVSGLPRSGTSLMMAMLEAGGIAPLTDGARGADADNPRGYYELERVKRLPEDAGWLSEAGGRAVKVVSELLRHLPDDRRYRVVFMRRRLDEILASQAKMLERRGEPPGASEADLRALYQVHLEAIFAWLDQAPHATALYLSYNRLLSDPAPHVARLSEFVGRPLDTAAMASVIDARLYRNRTGR